MGVLNQATHTHGTWAMLCGHDSHHTGGGSWHRSGIRDNPWAYDTHATKQQRAFLAVSPLPQPSACQTAGRPNHPTMSTRRGGSTHVRSARTNTRTRTPHVHARVHTQSLSLSHTRRRATHPHTHTRHPLAQAMNTPCGK